VGINIRSRFNFLGLFIRDKEMTIFYDTYLKLKERYVCPTGLYNFSKNRKRIKI